ncbi:TPA: hypothetical protein ACQJO4_002498 [Vibrio parahaemolyticus]
MLELMVTWGLTYEQFCEQPISVIYRLYQAQQVKPFLNSSSWVQTGTVAAAVYNVNMGKKSKALAYDDIYPFMKPQNKVSIQQGTDEESQLEIHRRVNALLG